MDSSNPWPEEYIFQPFFHVKSISSNTYTLHASGVSLLLAMTTFSLESYFIYTLQKYQSSFQEQAVYFLKPSTGSSAANVNTPLQSPK